MVRAVTRMKELFGILKLYQAQIPSYPSGHWLFSFASKDAHPIKDLDKTFWREIQVKTRYYNEEIHGGCFALPNYIKEDILNETN
jgi:spermidine synthase